MRYAVLLVAFAALACNRKQITAPPSKQPDENLTGQQRVAGAMPIVPRTIGQHDLGQLRTFLVNAQAESGKYPATLADLAGIEREAPHLAKAIQSGDVVLAGGRGGILAYEKLARESRGSVITTSGVEMMTKEQLEQALGR